MKKNINVVIACDHARYFGLVPGLEDPSKVIQNAIEAKADAIMTSYGIAKHYRQQLEAIPTFVRLDGGYTVYREEWLKATEWRLLHSVDAAKELGFQGVCLMLFMDAECELQTLEIVSRVAEECQKHNLSLMVEALPCPISSTRDPELIGCACRLAFEHGADIVKTYYSGNVDTFAKAIKQCPVPVLIAGGVKLDTEKDVLQLVDNVMKGGAKGVVFGRNVWQSQNSQKMIRDIKSIVDSYLR